MAEIYSFVQEASRNDQMTVTNTSIEIANARQFAEMPRKVITVRNVADDPTKIITVNLGANPAVAGKGIVLRQYESFTDAADGQYQPWQGTITAICAVASVTADLSIFER
jgi:hypothetical protein